MGTKVTLTLPDDVYQRAKLLAQLSHQDVAQVLTDAILASLPLQFPRDEVPPPIEGLSDSQVLSLSNLQLEPAEDRRLSELLDHQQAGVMTKADRSELDALLQSYQEGLLRKAQALQEAVRRGLLEPAGVAAGWHPPAE